MAPFDYIKGADTGYKTDGWDGYAASRQRILDMIVNKRINNPVSIGGEIHAFYAGVVNANVFDLASPPVLSELVCTSVSSGGGGDERYHETLDLFSENPFARSQEKFQQHDRELYGAIYAGAWDRERRVQLPPDGPPENAQIQPEHAVDFIIETIRNDPGDITIAALGPLTNLALALRKAPDVVTRIGKIVYMGGTFFVWGNVTTAAEFNWWFDAEAVSIVLSEPIRHIIIPLDATDRILFDKSLYDRFVLGQHRNHFMVTDFSAPKFSQKIKENPDYKLPVWDALAAAFIAQPKLVLEIENYRVGVDTNDGPDYGRSLATPVVSDFSFMKSFRPFSSQQAEVILKLDSEKFWQVYERLLFAE